MTQTDRQPSSSSENRKQEVTRWKFLKVIQGPIKATATVDSREVIGKINPRIFGQCVEYFEKNISAGIWKEDTFDLRADTLRLIKELKPPLLRCSADGMQDSLLMGSAPARFDAAEYSEDERRHGIDAFMNLCQQVNAEAFVVLDCGSVSVEEAARLVAYCNQQADTEQGSRRAAAGHHEPYAIRLWGVQNKAWTPGQRGYLTAEEYANRLRLFADAMRAVDSQIEIVASGQLLISDAVADPGRKWNEVVLRLAGGVIDHLSIHIFQPDRDGLQVLPDAEKAYHSVAAAPLDVEAAIQRAAAQVKLAAGGRKIGIAVDEWNLWLAPLSGGSDSRQTNYLARDAVYTAGVLNVFLRQSGALSLASLANLVNVSALIETNERRAIATPIYYPFMLFQRMESTILQVQTVSPTFNALPLGSAFSDHEKVPYVDISATRSVNGQRLVLGLINRHPYRRAFLTVNLKNFHPMRPVRGFLLDGPSAFSMNTFDAPNTVHAREVKMPSLSTRDHIRLDIPPVSLSIMILE